MLKPKTRYTSFLNTSLTNFKKYYKKSIWNKIKIWSLCVFLIVLGSMYGIGRWYIASESSKPLHLGTSFIPDYAESLGVDPEANFKALLSINVKQFRLVSYWSDMEQTKGTYDFSQLDWQFKDAETSHAKIILTVGLRQPRWPECHAPTWTSSEPASVWQPQLYSFMSAVVERYKNSPALQSYQLENEYFLKGFGGCTDFSRSRLVSEYNLVMTLDPNHPIIVSRSNNDIGTPIGKPTPDMFSVSIYRRVWDAAVTKRYIQYPYPGWYYGFLAGVQKITTGKDMMIGELQAEAWPPHGQSITSTSLSEQNKSLDANRLQDTFNFGKSTGMKSIDMWGAEYWYYRMEVLHDPSLWNVAINEYKN